VHRASIGKLELGKYMSRRSAGMTRTGSGSHAWSGLFHFAGTGGVTGWPAMPPREDRGGAGRGRCDSAGAVGDTTLGQVVGGQLNTYLVAGQDADVVLAHLA